MDPISSSTARALSTMSAADRADQLKALAEEMKKIDPTTPEGSKRMMEINRQLNRIDEMIRMVSEMRRSRHEANMAAIGNIA